MTACSRIEPAAQRVWRDGDGALVYFFFHWKTLCIIPTHCLSCNKQSRQPRLHDQSVTEVTHSILPNMGIKLLSFSLLLSFMSHWLQWVGWSLHIRRSQLACSFHQRRMSVASALASQPWSREVTRLFIGYFRDQPWKTPHMGMISILIKFVEVKQKYK